MARKPDEVEQALREIGDLVRCVCHPAYRDRGLQDPDCRCDSAPALLTLRRALGFPDHEAADGP